MDFNKYQEESKRTAVYPNQGNNYIYPVLGLTGEAGEVAEKIKKIIRDKAGQVSDEDKLELSKELGDVMWYVAQLATEFNLKMSDIAQGNLDKLHSRIKRGVLHGSGDNR